MEPRISLLCVDDHHLVRAGIAALVDVQPDLKVVGVAASGEEAIARYQELRPDVVLMDLQMEGISGLDAIRAIRAADPTAKIVVVTMHHGEEDVYRALEAGAMTYLLKDALPDELVHTIRAVQEGRRPLSAEVEAILKDRSSDDALSGREVQIVELVAEGCSNKDIALELGIALETVRAHLRNIFGKLGVKDRTAAVREAIRRGNIHVG